jgi:hypothetical protein
MFLNALNKRMHLDCSIKPCGHLVKSIWKNEELIGLVATHVFCSNLIKSIIEVFNKMKSL